MKSLYWRMNAWNPVSPFAAVSLLGPCSARRRSTSAALRPFSRSAPTAAATVALSAPYHSGFAFWTPVVIGLASRARGNQWSEATRTAVDAVHARTPLAVADIHAVVILDDGGLVERTLDRTAETGRYQPPNFERVAPSGVVNRSKLETRQGEPPNFIEPPA